ncbi:hypothetical protein [Parvicella tangerina]|uniref:Uncharacterized protein n=1 Tax=Parvicella tangerina TaxID=2829795 RepID=A0A916JL85_9FLAO|nr:hypothetical protein [Parvicella tangerina]CAG5078462.1 hypothetical protein CRYO30217_00679 [Parvicella tangerina]
MNKKTNIAPEGKSEFWKKLYTNFNVGILAMLMGILLPFVVPIMGQFFSPIFFIGGIIAVLWSKQPIWMRVLAVVVFIIPLILLWDQYVLLIYNFMNWVSQPA